MFSSESGSASLLKSVLFKGFFCLGVGTACVLAYDRAFAPAEIAEPSMLEKKVGSLIQNPELAQDLEQVVQHQKRNEPETAVVQVGQSFSEAESVSADAQASEPATLTPDASPAASPMENALDGNGGQTEETPVVEYQPAEAIPPQNYYANNPDGSGDLKEHSSSNAEAPQAPSSIPFIGAITSFFQPVVAPQQQPRGIVSTNSQTTQGSEQSTLKASDLPLLTSSIKGVFSDRTENVSGTLCADGQVNSASCTKEPHYQVHTSRWAPDAGLTSDVGFSITGTSISDLHGNLTLKLQNDQLVVTPHTLSGSITNMAVVNENRSGHKYRIFTFNISELTINTEKLTSVAVSLIFDISSSAGYLTSESNLVFSRAKVQTIPLAWDSSNPNRNPAAGQPVIIADQVQYSVSLEKAQ